MYEILTEDQERIQAHPPSVAELFGENLGPDPFEDAGTNRSADRHAKMVRSREQAAAERRDLAVIARAAADQDDDNALDRATELLRQRKPVPVALRIRATRAANRRGTSIPTHEQLAARYRRPA
jgi:hypothetical protein